MKDMKKMPLITIIVPVYQVKDYIRECVESLLEQTYTNLEILLVDDGSTDGSEVICDEYAVKDERVRVIHQENQGAASARNAGLNQENGEYIAFVDADDIVLPEFIETLYKLLDKYQADIAGCANVKGEIGQKVSSYNGKEICMSSEQMLRQWHGKYKKWETVVWNKLYHRSVLNGEIGGMPIRFPTGRKFEDVLISHLIVNHADRIVLTTQVLYRYRIRPGSCSSQILITAENRKQNLRAQRERMVFFREKRYWRAYWNLCIGYMLHLCWFGWKALFSKY